MDPELPQSLEELKVVTEDSIEVDDEQSYVRVSFTPTNGHCNQISVIGLCIRIKLIRSLPSRYKIDIRVSPGTHNDEAAENKRFNDKDLVAAVMERPGVLELVDYYLEPTFA